MSTSMEPIVTMKYGTGRWLQKAAKVELVEYQALLCMERVDMIFTNTWASSYLPQQSKTKRFSQLLFLVHLTWPDVVGTDDVLTLSPIQLKESGLFWLSENEPCSLKALIPFGASRIAERRGNRERRIADTQPGSIGGFEPLSGLAGAYLFRNPGQFHVRTLGTTAFFGACEESSTNKIKSARRTAVACPKSIHWINGHIVGLDRVGLILLCFNSTSKDLQFIRHYKAQPDPMLATSYMDRIRAGWCDNCLSFPSWSPSTTLMEIEVEAYPGEQ
ncbi:predicted protein [Histoplasma capsulatum var. duboisii H88]|uniref:Predicted protein n=1 Tax=Ajellomyces capsulatus (strain H88) TaxID=544711 RepID=F0U7A9_AJEC8|nr:predicted protein [Histoplasma capsulatum var. duboisii H88]